MTTTITILIGNSDNKLTQRDWQRYIQEVRWQITHYCIQPHFNGGSPFDSEFQNACFVAEIMPSKLDHFKKHLTSIRTAFGQDSLAILVGTTEFI